MMLWAYHGKQIKTAKQESRTKFINLLDEIDTLGKVFTKIAINKNSMINGTHF